MSCGWHSVFINAPSLVIFLTFYFEIICDVRTVQRVPIYIFQSTKIHIWSDFIHIPLLSPLMSFICSRILFRMQHCIQLSSLFQPVVFSQSYFLQPWYFWRLLVKYFVWFDVLSCLDWGYGFQGRMQLRWNEISTMASSWLLFFFFHLFLLVGG